MSAFASTCSFMSVFGCHAEALSYNPRRRVAHSALSHKRYYDNHITRLTGLVYNLPYVGTALCTSPISANPQSNLDGAGGSGNPSKNVRVAGRGIKR